MKSTIVETSLGNINIRISGQGPAMLCWPSLLMTGLMWAGQAKHFSSSFQVILIDPPGQGLSDRLNTVFTLEECARCLSEILQALKISECVLLGNSWGGMMGGVFTALFPQQIRAAILMNCTASVASDSQKRAYSETIKLLRNSDVYPQSLIEQSVKAFAGKTTELKKPDVINQIRETISKVDPQSVSWAIESVVPRRTDQHALLKNIRKPVLLIAGEEDRTFSVVETKRMADVIPNSVFHVLPKVGHLAALESPDVVNDEIDKFLARALSF